MRVSVKTNVGNSAFVYISDGQGYALSPMHVGDNDWHYLTIQYHVKANATFLGVYLAVYDNNATAYFDEVKLTYENNIVSNGDMESGTPPTGWTLYGSGAAFNRSTTTYTDSYSGALTRNGYDTVVTQVISDGQFMDGDVVTLGAWVWASQSNSVFIYIDDGNDYTISQIHPGSSTWQWLTVTHTVSTGSNFVGAYLSRL